MQTNFRWWSSRICELDCYYFIRSYPFCWDQHPWAQPDPSRERAQHDCRHVEVEMFSSAVGSVDVRLKQTLHFDWCSASREVSPLVLCEEQSSSTEPLGSGEGFEAVGIGGMWDFIVIPNATGGNGWIYEGRERSEQLHEEIQPYSCIRKWNPDLLLFPFEVIATIPIFSLWILFALFFFFDQIKSYFLSLLKGYGFIHKESILMHIFPSEMCICCRDTFAN